MVRLQPAANRHLAIVPALNEVESIARTVQDIRRCAPEFDVLVVDDGSTDGTGRAAAAAGAIVVRLPFNLGIGGAVQTGYIYAREHGYQVAVQLDGDGQHDAKYIPELLSRLTGDDGFNMVTGSRFLEAADDTGYRSSAPRRAGIGIFARVVSIASRQRVTDPTSGFRMTDRHAIELFARDYPHDYPEVEAILLMHSHRLRSCEIPVQMRARTTGRSAISRFQAAYYMVKVLLAVFVGLFRARPTGADGEDPPVAAERSL
jgi:glycosyltransferase involved in cell wall biosynthesis